MISILLEDFTNKLFQKLANLSEERELHIRNNIIVLNKVKPQYTVYYFGVNNSIADLEKKGYKEDQGLYDRRIIDYNNDNPENILRAWIM
ncbi:MULTISPECIES: hypothetical protein [Flavobacterium]|uniref:Uncharacterized protein n=1 Tax=Flavobacterium lipolyticum TaxID=2893754 RepID=A0ABS8LZA9_9FLAO|nr:MULTISPECIES: hypothetical protein [unclassified Flavobacterium]MCC9017906.1 hypothetical protein [Flavobacterium sp. F-126]